ncbi:MAG: helix-turn-helix domain-containing protein, partial [Acidimicrobiia bacterium]
GVGLGHDRVPPDLLTAAVACRVPVFVVPYETPFIAIARHVAEQVIASRYEATMRTFDVHERLAAVLLSGEGLTGLVTSTSRAEGRPCALVDFHGRILASEPVGSSWPIDQVLRNRTASEPWDGDELAAFPIVIEGTVTAILCARGARSEDPVLRSAATLIGLELSRRTAILTGRRLLLGQVLEDIIQGVLSEEESQRRVERFGLDGSMAFSVVVGAVPGHEERLQQASWAVQTLVAQRGDQIETALVEGRLVLVVHAGADLAEVARMTLERLRRLSDRAAVGVGGTHVGIGGLRRSLLEALSAANRGPGVHDPTALSLTGTLGFERSGVAIAEAMLGPLVVHDRESGSDLIGTLVAYLRNDCRVGPTADELALHRNGLAYRLERIHRLTGRDPYRMEDRVELLLAARVTGRM